MSEAGFEVKDIRFVNRPGVFGWWLNSRVLKRTVLPKGQLAIFKWLMPILKREETKPPSFGMSLLVLGRATLGAGPGARGPGLGQSGCVSYHAYNTTARRNTRRAVAVFTRDPSPGTRVPPRRGP